MDIVLFSIPNIICIIIFGGVGVFALKTKKPMHFWSGSTIEPWQINDVKAYNKANAKMWFCYCIPLVVSMFVFPFSENAAGVILTLGILGGLIIILIVHSFIDKKYRTDL